MAERLPEARYPLAAVHAGAHVDAAGGPGEWIVYRDHSCQEVIGTFATQEDADYFKRAVQGLSREWVRRGERFVTDGNPAEPPECGPDTLYEYTFATWPDEQNPRWNRALFDLWRYGLSGILCMEFTDRQFRDFEEAVGRCGITLREVVRRPFLESEMVR